MSYSSHSRSHSDDLSNLPPTLSIRTSNSTATSNLPTYPWSDPLSSTQQGGGVASADSSQQFNSSLAHLPSSSPSSDFDIPHYSHSTQLMQDQAIDAFPAFASSSSSTGLSSDSSNSHLFRFDTQFGPPNFNHETQGSMAEGKGEIEGEGDARERRMEIIYEGLDSNSTGQDWFSSSNGFNSQREMSMEDGNDGQEYQNDQGGEYSFNFDFDQNQSPTIVPTEYEGGVDLSPLSEYHEPTSSTTHSPSKWFEQSQPPRATYGLSPSSLSPTQQFEPFSSSPPQIATYHHRRASAAPSMINTQFTSRSPFDNFPSFSSSLLNQPSSAPATVPTQFEQPFFVPSSSTYSTSALAQQPQHDFNLQPDLDSISERQVSPSLNEFSPSPSSDFFPSPLSLPPVASPLLSSLPQPSPSFQLDSSSSSDPSTFSLPPPQSSIFKRIPPSQLSLIDLPALPLPSPPIPVPSSSPPPATPVTPSTNKKKKRRTSRAPTSPSPDPSISPESRISPITGKPTKQIAKRQYPPKDQSKRIYYCPFEGCKKNCEYTFYSRFRGARIDECFEGVKSGDLVL